MAKQKSFHSKLIAKIKRDSRYVWTGELIEAIAYGAFSKRMKEPVPQDARKLLGILFPCFQQESFVASSYEVFLGAGVDAGDYDHYPPIYPALMVGWEMASKCMELEASAVEFLKGVDADFGEVPLEALKRPFPACILIDTRAFRFSMYDISVDGVFVYPSYDADRKYAMLHFLGVSMKRGLSYALEAKLVLKGNTLREAMLASEEEENRLIRRDVLAGFDRGGHDVLFSPLDDERQLMEFASRILAFSFSKYALTEERSFSDGAHLRVSLHLQEELPQMEGEHHEVVVEIEQFQHTEVATEPEIAVDDGEAVDSIKLHVTANDAKEEPADEAMSQAGSMTVANASLGYDELLTMVDELMTENDALKLAISTTENQNASLSYHLKQAQESLGKLRDEGEALSDRASLVETMSIPETPLEALGLAEKAFSDRLIIMDEARKSARNFERGSVAETWAVLQAMAVTLHRLVFGQASGNLTHAFKSETGFEITLRDVKHTNKNSEYAKERQVVYAGEKRDITAHVKGRGIKKGECLRVHFFADYEAGKIVIAHCGEHLTTIETSRL